MKKKYMTIPPRHHTYSKIEVGTPVDFQLNGWSVHEKGGKIFPLVTKDLKIIQASKLAVLFFMDEEA